MVEAAELKMKLKKEKLIYGLVVVGLVTAVGFYLRLDKQGKSMVSHTEAAEVTKVDAKQADELINDEKVFVVDVHTPEAKHLEGTDAFVPYDQIADNMDKLPVDKEKPILVYCRSGSMSGIASKELVNLGYKNVYDLAGGVTAYREAHVGVEMKPEMIDLGEVDYYKGAMTEFTLVNNTNKELKLTRVTGSCACTQPKAEADVVEAYGSVKIKVNFVPSVHKDDSDLGQLTRTVFVETDNPNFETVEAKFSANVIKN